MAAISQADYHIIHKYSPGEYEAIVGRTLGLMASVHLLKYSSHVRKQTPPSTIISKQTEFFPRDIEEAFLLSYLHSKMSSK